jgi:hypothetical protein
MSAQVLYVEDGIVTVQVKRQHVYERLYLRHYDVQVGQWLSVKRVSYNPYLVRV